MKPILIIAAIFCSTFAHADAGLTPFDKLKALYSAAAAPKSLAEAEAAILKTNYCAESISTAPETVLSSHYIVSVDYSTPGQGPEFPGETYRMIILTDGRIDSPSGSEAVSSFRPILTAQELQLETLVYSSHTKCPHNSNSNIDDCWDSISTLPAKLNIKLSAKYILFQLDNNTFGYCWKQ